jgi:hypothetical protein
VGARRHEERDGHGAAGDVGRAVVTALDIGPGVHDIPEADYHADKTSLSFSGAKRLLPPSCPAIFKWERDNGRPHKRQFDLGHAVHAKVLGVGAEVVVVQKVTKDRTKVDADDYNTLSAQKHRDEIYAEGKTPLLRKEAEQVDGMAASIARHAVCRALFDPDHGKPEQSLYRIDEPTGVLLRHRLDWLPEPVDGRMVIGDLKTTTSPLDARSLGKVMWAYRYDMQAAAYSDAPLALGLAESVGFVFVFVQTTAPFVVSVDEPDAEAVAIGRADFRRAIDIYARCAAEDRWPGWNDDDIELISLPRYAIYDREDAA